MYGWRQCHHSACELLASHGFIVLAVDHAPDCMVARPVGQGKESVPFNHRTDEPSGEELLLCCLLCVVCCAVNEYDLIS